MEILITSIIAFISTNIDDLFILVLFYGNKRIRERDIVIGQLLGISCLIGLSLLGSLIGLFIGKPYVGLLGFVPIYLGIREIWRRLGKKEDDLKSSPVKTSNSNILSVAGVTIANGGDNIGIYVPLFAALHWQNRIVMVIVFLVMTLVWCITAKYFTKHPFVARNIQKYGDGIIPFVLVLLGIYILYESGAVRLLVM